MNELARAKHNLRARLYYALKHNAQVSFTNLEACLGISLSELRPYVERQFAIGMSWENYGKVWEIDHIVPLVTASSIEDVHFLFYYMNLQPAFVADNRPGSPFIRRSTARKCNNT